MNRFSLSKTARGVALALATAAFAAGMVFLCSTVAIAADVLAEFKDPPREFSVMPFWFWNDDMRDDEIVRQIADFETHGVYGFVIHPRIGLPRDIGWLSPRMIHAMHVAVAEAVRRRMYVILYDEGMYPSGSSAGQVVARNPSHAARGLAKIDLRPGESPNLEDGGKLVATLDRPNGGRLAVVERPTGGVIRGLHYIGEETGRLKEELPPAGDILNPAAVSSFIELVYDRYAQEFGRHFGKTILGIFTDEPSPTGRGGARGMLPGNAALFEQVNRILGYDFKPFLADLWYNDRPDAAQHRADYHRAIVICLEENYYRRLSQWCDKHGIALTGHPGGSMDIGAERYFQMPGQDLVWRMVVPGPKALEGADSTTAKCASSAMVHLGRRRNANELYGAYGHNLTYEEMEWLAGWCLVRGHNLLYPHAFYYSVRGPRRDERPPDVGPNAAWWDRYRPYADYCRRLSWLNTDSRQVCEVAILAEPARLPDQSAKVCFQHQRDFNYLEMRHLGEDAQVQPDGVHLAGMHYRAVILDGALHVPATALPALQKLASNQRLIILGRSPRAAELKGARAAATAAELPAAIDALVKSDLTLVPPSKSIRYRHVVKGGRHFYILFNEEESPVTAQVGLSVRGSREWLDPSTAAATPAPPAEAVVFKPHQLKVLTAAALGPSE
jgi:hypothetical protein